jgi:hypothetical protein
MAKTNKSAGGIGESRIFAAALPDGELTGVDRILQCHINGVQIVELNLEPQILGVLDYWATDEGIAEKAARPGLVDPSGITLGADGFSKSLEQRRDDVLDRDMDSYQARDPLKEVSDRHAVIGMAPKFLSEKKIKDGGTTGDYQIVKDAAGDPVKVRGMVLGHMPAERAAAKNKHFREKGNQLLKAIGDTYKKEGGSTAVSDQ